MGLVNGRGRFSTHPTAPKLEIYNYLQGTTPHAKFRGLHRRGCSGEIASLTHESFFLFSFLRHAHRSHFWTHPHAQYVIICHSRQGSAFWGLEWWNLKFDPIHPPKNEKFWTLSWRSMENCSRPNSGTVSHIQFKLGTPKSHDSKVKRSRSHGHILYIYS